MLISTALLPGVNLNVHFSISSLTFILNIIEKRCLIKIAVFALILTHFPLFIWILCRLRSKFVEAAVAAPEWEIKMAVSFANVAIIVDVSRYSE